MDPEREGGVQVHPAHAAHVLLVVAGPSYTGGPVHRGLVDSALVCSLQLDVAVLTPALSPGVPHQPVVKCSPASQIVNVSPHCQSYSYSGPNSVPYPTSCMPWLMEMFSSKLHPSKTPPW